MAVTWDTLQKLAQAKRRADNRRNEQLDKGIRRQVRRLAIDSEKDTLIRLDTGAVKRKGKKS